MQAFSTLVDLFGRLTGIRDPSVPLPIDSPLSGGKRPPPVLQRIIREAPVTPEEAARYNEIREQVVEEFPPAPQQSIQSVSHVDQFVPSRGIIPMATTIRILVPGDDPECLSNVVLTHENARWLMTALLHHYGLPADFHGG